MRNTLLLVGAAVGLIILLSLVMAIPTWLLWNWLLPDLFGFPEVTLTQALGLVVLGNILFNTSTTSKR